MWSVIWVFPAEAAMPDPIAADLRDLLALNLIPNLGPRLTAALLKHFGSAGAVRGATAAELRQVPLIGPKLSEQFAAALGSVDVDRECQRLAEHDVRLIALGTPDYPPALASIPDPPHLLY